MSIQNNVNLDLVLPVYNEEKILEKNVKKTISFMADNFSEQWRIIIADNGSTDRTADIAEKLNREFSGKIKCLHRVKKGRGGALKQAWGQSRAEIVGYMDIDLATDLKMLPSLISAIKNGADVSVGSRLSPASVIRRSLLRKILSLAYHLIIKVMFRITKIADFQCGFKACKRTSIHHLLPQVMNEEWFFDTELLVTAQRRGLKIKEIPVEWTEHYESKVRILKDVFTFLVAIIKFRLGL
ncbi:MAG: dolichyl-phosphate beta-glucosyltransferase [Planctomycetota bacterium]